MRAVLSMLAAAALISTMGCGGGAGSTANPASNPCEYRMAAGACHVSLVQLLQTPEALDDLALNLHTANVQRDRMPRRRLSSTDIVAQTLPKLQARVSAIYGEHDALYRGRLPELQAAMQGWSTHWGQWHTVPGAGHWVQYEAADAFNTALLSQLMPL